MDGWIRTACTAAAAIVFTAATVSASHQASQTTGRIAGCVTQIDGSPLPGVAVAVRDRTFRRIEVTDSTGCFEMESLPAGTYSLIGGLAGFVSATRDIEVAGGRVTKVDLRLRIGAHVDYVTPTGPLSTYWDKADAVVHLRLIGHEPGPLDESIPTVRHTADVLHLLKAHRTAGPTGSTMTFLQHQTAEEPEPYDVGREFVVFLHWDSFLPQDSFVRFYGPMLVFAVENGRVQRGPSPVVNRYSGVPIENFLR